MINFEYLVDVINTRFRISRGLVEFDISNVDHIGALLLALLHGVSSVPFPPYSYMPGIIPEAKELAEYILKSYNADPATQEEVYRTVVEEFIPLLKAYLKEEISFKHLINQMYDKLHPRSELGTKLLNLGVSEEFLTRYTAVDALLFIGYCHWSFDVIFTGNTLITKSDIAQMSDIITVINNIITTIKSTS